MAIDPITGAIIPDGGGLMGVVEQIIGTPDYIRAETQDQEDVIPRDAPEPTDQRKALVAAWSSRVKTAKGHWDKAFKRMIDDQDFCFGYQWSKNPEDPRYVANLTLRLVAQKVAFLYAKNPKAVAQKRERINNTVWDGNETTLQSIVQAGQMMMAQAAAAGPMGIGGPMGAGPGGPAAPPGGPMMGGLSAGAGPGGVPGAMASIAANPALQAAAAQSMAIVQDAARVKQENAMLDKLGKTLELLYAYNIDSQVHPFKQMMKLVVRRAVTTGVGYVKLGFERVMEKRPDLEKGIADASERLATLERLAADLADDVTDENSKECEQLRLLIMDLSKDLEFVAREGLTFDYPLPTNIIPDPKTIELRNFLGADWVAEQYMLTKNDIEEIYGVDVGTEHNSYTLWENVRGPDPVQMAREIMAGYQWLEGGKSADRQYDFCCVWDIYSRKDGLVYTICDGYSDFLREPAQPEIYNEHFWPWYPLVFNECMHETEIFPPSDVRLMRDMQREYNRCREGLKEQRIAARPFTAVVAGTMEEEDLEKLSEREANAIVELNALQPNQDVKQLLQAYSGPGIDPNLYEVNPVYEDVLRTTGIQEANLGGVQQDTTATQAQIAEGSRMTSMGSNIDDLNDMLTQLARNGGQILLAEVQPQTVQTQIGQGAVWPQFSRQQITNEIYLEIEAGSMGRPNAAAEIANAQRIYPLLIQIPGLDPNYLAKDLLRRLDDRLDLTQAFKNQLPSIVAMNGMARGIAPGAGAPAGAAQGPQGANNPMKAMMPHPGGAPDMTGQMTGAPPPGAPGAAPPPGG
jgi:hypothetical protein